MGAKGQMVAEMMNLRDEDDIHNIVSKTVRPDQTALAAQFPGSQNL